MREAKGEKRNIFLTHKKDVDMKKVTEYHLKLIGWSEDRWPNRCVRDLMEAGDVVWRLGVTRKRQADQIDSFSAKEI